MKRIQTAACIVALTAITSSSQAAAKSRGHGGGAPSLHRVNNAPIKNIASPHRAFRRFPIFGVPYSAYYLPDYFGYGFPEGYDLPPEPPRALNCERTQQTVIVPSESGGTRAITVTRCGAP